MDQETSEQPEQKTPPPKKRWAFLTKLSPWEYIFQFLMLFLAVTAGFFAENIREEQGEFKQSQEYAKSMLKELTTDMGNIHYHIYAIKKAIQNVNALAKYTHDKSFDKLTNAELFRLTRINSNPPFRWNLATLDQIKSSGRLQYFKNDSIVEYISQYNAWTQHLDQDNVEDRLSYRYATELTNRIVNSNYTEQEKTEITKNKDSVAINGKYPSPPLSKNANEIYGMVNAYITARDLSIGHMEELKLASEDQARIIRLLKREYGIK